MKQATELGECCDHYVPAASESTGALVSFSYTYDELIILLYRALCAGGASGVTAPPSGASGMRRTRSMRT